MRKLITIFTVLLVLAACSEKDKPDNFEPQLHIGEVKDITRTEATVTGNIIVFGNTPLPELTFQSLEVMAVSRMTFELWLVTAAMYLMISCFWAWLGRRFEMRR